MPFAHVVLAVEVCVVASCSGAGGCTFYIFYFILFYLLGCWMDEPGLFSFDDC